jgi:hypothetical protein
MSFHSKKLVDAAQPNNALYFDSILIFNLIELFLYSLIDGMNVINNY